MLRKGSGEFFLQDSRSGEDPADSCLLVNSSFLLSLVICKREREGKAERVEVFVDGDCQQ